MDKIVTEFIQTERVYCNFLELTLEYFFKIVPISNGIKDPKDVQLFRELQTNWGQLYQFHTSFLLTLETRCLLGGGKVGSQMTESGSHSVVARSTGNSNSNSNSNNSLHPLVLKKNAAQGLANVVIKLSPYFKLYSGYCRLYPLILPILEAAQENSTEFEAAVKHFESLPRAKNLSLGSIIVKPIQRVCKYELFLRDLQKKIPPNNVDLMTDVVMAYTATQNVVGKVNETGKTGEQLAKLAELQEQLRPLGKVNVLKSHRRLDLQGNAMAVQMLPNGESNNDRSGSSNNSSNNSNSNSNSNSSLPLLLLFPHLLPPQSLLLPQPLLPPRLPNLLTSFSRCLKILVGTLSSVEGGCLTTTIFHSPPLARLDICARHPCQSTISAAVRLPRLVVVVVVVVVGVVVAAALVEEVVINPDHLVKLEEGSLGLVGCFVGAKKQKVATLSLSRQR